MERLKTDPTWDQVVANADHLDLMQLIWATVMSQTGDQYPFLTIQKQELNLQGHHQAIVTTDLFVEKFNTKVDVFKVMGIRFQHTTLIEYVAKDVHDKEFKDLTEAQKTEVEKYSEERYLDFLMLRNSGKEHDCLRDDLNNNYAKDNNQYPNTRHQCAYLLQKYSKNKVAIRVAEEHGKSFLQANRGGRGGRGGCVVRSNGSGNVHYNKQD